MGKTERELGRKHLPVLQKFIKIPSPPLSISEKSQSYGGFHENKRWTNEQDTLCHSPFPSPPTHHCLRAAESTANPRSPDRQVSHLTQNAPTHSPQHQPPSLILELLHLSNIIQYSMFRKNWLYAKLCLKGRSGLQTRPEQQPRR